MRKVRCLVEIAPTTGAGKYRYRVALKSTLRQRQELQVRIDGGEWETVGFGIYREREPKTLGYRRLAVAKSTPFKLQADAINDVSLLNIDYPPVPG